MNETPFYYKLEIGNQKIAGSQAGQMQLRVLPTAAQLMLVDLVSMVKDNREPKYQKYC